MDTLFWLDRVRSNIEPGPTQLKKINFLFLIVFYSKKLVFNIIQ
jgi:hypothetical protein